MKIHGTGGRTLHRRLLAMHVVASVNMSAGAAKYMFPLSDASCRVSHRAWIASLLLYDVSAPQAACLVLFLLAKTSVTNGNRTLTSWEKGITWWSRFWAWIYLPVSATVLGLRFPGEVNSEGTACFNSYGEETETREVGDVAGFASNNVLLTVQCATEEAALAQVVEHESDVDSVEDQAFCAVAVPPGECGTVGEVGLVGVVEQGQAVYVADTAATCSTFRCPDNFVNYRERSGWVKGIGGTRPPFLF
ncbi:unnamed protein product [Ectocarpus sp. CCAP 1310/34]|nr:unnamed protein product [Ectocarpus sp. CCAP 1310/34]